MSVGIIQCIYTVRGVGLKYYIILKNVTFANSLSFNTVSQYSNNYNDMKEIQIVAPEVDYDI